MLRFVGDLSALDTSMQIRQVALSVLFENIEVIGQDLLAGPIKELSPGYFNTVSALTIGYESLQLFDDFEQGAILFTGLKRLHLKLDTQVPDGHSFRGLRASNQLCYFEFLGLFGGKLGTIRHLQEKYSGETTPKLTVQMTLSHCDDRVSIFCTPRLEALKTDIRQVLDLFIRDRIMYVDDPVFGNMNKLPFILMLSEALGMRFITSKKGELRQRVWNHGLNAYIWEEYEDKSVLSWAEMMWSL